MTLKLSIVADMILGKPGVRKTSEAWFPTRQHDLQDADYDSASGCGSVFVMLILPEHDRITTYSVGTLNLKLKTSNRNTQKDRELPEYFWSISGVKTWWEYVNLPLICYHYFIAWLYHAMYSLSRMHSEKFQCSFSIIKEACVVAQKAITCAQNLVIVARW